MLVNNERAENKIKGWKASTLSVAGRITLTKVVTGSMTIIYPMLHDRVPTGVLEEVERMQRKFVWGDTERVVRCGMP